MARVSFNDLKEKMEQVGSNGASTFKMRAENLQQKNVRKKLNNLKNELKKKSKLLLVMELAIPFDPETGKAEENGFNPDNKYRPALSATTVALSLKELASRNEVTKQVFMQKAGVTEWDLSDLETLTEDDWKIFKKYRVPRIFTIPACEVRIPAMTKSSYGKNYAMSLDVDPENPPVVHKISYLYTDIIQERLNEYAEQLEKGIYTHDDKQQKEHRGKIFQTRAVNHDVRLNWVTLIEIPLTHKFEVSSEFDITGATSDSVGQHAVLSRYKKSIQDVVKLYNDGSLDICDVHFDYIELDMQCPTEGDMSTDTGKMLVGKDTKFEKPFRVLNTYTGHEQLDASISLYLDENPDIEETVKNSVFVNPYTPEVEHQVCMALPSVLNLDDPYITKKILLKHQDIIRMIYGDAGDMAIAEAEMGMSDHAEGTLTEEGTAAVTQQLAELSLEDLNLEEELTE